MNQQDFSGFVKAGCDRLKKRWRRKDAAWSFGLGAVLVLVMAIAWGSAARAAKPDHAPQRNTDDCPHYCSTEVGVLGPYPNPGCRVKVGDACFGTDKQGQRQEGTVVAEKEA